MLGVRVGDKPSGANCYSPMSHNPKYQTKTMKLRNISGSLYNSPHTAWWRRCWGQRHRGETSWGLRAAEGAGAGNSLKRLKWGKGKDEAVALYLCSLSLPSHFRVILSWQSQFPEGLKFLFSFSQRLKWWKRNAQTLAKPISKAQ